MDSGLERLSPEVRRYLLSILDLPRMKALVHASPVFHQQYLLDRRYLLGASIGSTLQSVCLDAYAVRQSEKCTTPAHFIGLVETWGKQFPHGSPRQLTVSTTEEEAVRTVSRHLQTVVPVARYFANWALDDLARQTSEYENASTQQEPRTQPALSNTEWLRCLRAIYRFQLLCNVASPTIPGLKHSDAKNNAELLFNALPLWEVEELFSFYQFAQAVYNEIFDSIKNELRPDNPRFANQHRPPTPEGAFELDNDCKPAILSNTSVHLADLSRESAYCFGRHGTTRRPRPTFYCAFRHWSRRPRAAGKPNAAQYSLVIYSYQRGGGYTRRKPTKRAAP